VNREKTNPPAQDGKGFVKVGYLLWIAVLIAAVSGAYWLLSGDESVLNTNAPTFVVKKSDLVISVAEGGNLKALKSQEIKSGVEGSATILYLCPEGSRITEKDIEEGKILVQLDSSQIRERLKTQEITYQSANSDFILATEALNIQLKQNESDITAGELSVKFARLDLQRYLGREIANELIGISKKDLADRLFDPELRGSTEENTGKIRGAARQRKRELENAISLATEELERARKNLDWTIKLEDKGYVSENDLVADTIAMKRRTVDLEQARTDLDLFLDYEFYKEAEQLISDLEESKHQLDRTKARARAQEAQKKSSLEANRAKLELQKGRLDDYREQVAQCEIKASTPGLVVWNNNSGDMGRESRRIEEGGTVRQRQNIISIPDISTMAVEVKVHETSVDRVRVGQRAIVTVEALPDEVFEGEVLRIAVLPDQQSRWLNPDLKVYSTDVGIKGTHEVLKPGMSAQVEIIVKELRDILIVPIQAIVSRNDRHYCFVRENGNPGPVPVVTGDYNHIFIEIKEGLSEGDVVLVRPSSDEWQMIPLNGNGSGTKRAASPDRGAASGHGETEGAPARGMGGRSGEGMGKRPPEGMRRRPSDGNSGSSSHGGPKGGKK
jgi:HlyD family secretion protein